MTRSSSRLRAADSVLRADERELGVCLADIGAGSTSLVVFQEGAVAHTAVLPVGGDHFTSDLSVGLCTPLAEAEKIKKLYGQCDGHIDSRRQRSRSSVRRRSSLSPDFAAHGRRNSGARELASYLKCCGTICVIAACWRFAWLALS